MISARPTNTSQTGGQHEHWWRFIGLQDKTGPWNIGLDIHGRSLRHRIRRDHLPYRYGDITMSPSATNQNPGLRNARPRDIFFILMLYPISTQSCFSNQPPSSSLSVEKLLQYEFRRLFQ